MKGLILLTLLLAGCTNFSDAAWILKKKMNYEEHSTAVGEWEPLSASKNYRGDCSNFCASMQKAFPDANIWLGQIPDGRWHCITCRNGKCVDTLQNGIFKNYSDLWLRPPQKLILY